MADGLGFLHEVRGLPEVCVRTCRVDECANLALADYGGREHRVAAHAAGGSDSPVSADWSTSIGSPSKRRASAGTMSPVAGE